MATQLPPPLPDLGDFARASTVAFPKQTAAVLMEVTGLRLSVALQVAAGARLPPNRRRRSIRRRRRKFGEHLAELIDHLLHVLELRGSLP